MRKFFILIVALVFLKPLKSSCQVICHPDFQSTEWASYNKDSAFFKLDTVQLLRIYSKGDGLMSDTLNVARFFETDFVNMTFNDSANMIFNFTILDDWITKTVHGTYNWNYDRKRNILSLYFKGKLFSQFAPLYTRQVSVPSRFDTPDVNTVILYLKRIKF